MEPGARAPEKAVGVGLTGSMPPSDGRQAGTIPRARTTRLCLTSSGRPSSSCRSMRSTRVDPTPPGTLAVIPAPFLEYEAERASQLWHVPAYSNDLRQWVSLRQPSETWLLFRVPTQVLPLHVEHATAIVEIHAPLRLVEILGTSTRGTVRLGSRQGPQGKLRFETTNPGHWNPTMRAAFALGYAWATTVPIRAIGNGSRRNRARLGRLSPLRWRSPDEWNPRLPM